MDAVLAPVDNVLLANLCGPLDENIRQIETGFDVTIRRRNERLRLHFGHHQGCVDLGGEISLGQAGHHILQCGVDIHHELPKARSMARNCLHEKLTCMAVLRARWPT